MPRLKTESYGAGNFAWLGTRHGINNCRSVMLDVSAFTAATHYPDGYIRSGQPVAIVAGLLVPYDPTETVTTGAGVLAGHVFTDQRVSAATDADFAVPLYEHGRVYTPALPVAFTPPTAAAKQQPRISYYS